MCALGFPSLICGAIYWMFDVQAKIPHAGGALETLLSTTKFPRYYITCMCYRRSNKVFRAIFLTIRTQRRQEKLSGIIYWNAGLDLVIFHNLFSPKKWVNFWYGKILEIEKKKFGQHTFKCLNSNLKKIKKEESLFWLNFIVFYLKLNIF